MLKSDFVSKISEKTNLSKSDVLAIVDAFTDIVIDTVKKEDIVQIKGFGTFYSSLRKERQGRNPKTGEPVIIPSSFSLKFKSSKMVKNNINNI